MADSSEKDPSDDENERHTSWRRRAEAAPVAHRKETEAIAAVQKALGAEADTRARLDQDMLRQQAELSKAALAVQEAQAALVRTSGLERAAALIDVSSKALKAAVREAKQEPNVKPTSNHAPVQISP